MIVKINKIKNLQSVLCDYSWNSQLPDFKRYNLIYGWNGTGKTTLSKVFDALETGIHKSFPDLEYEMQDEKGVVYKQGEAFSKKVRVFNQDYVENNIKIREGRAKAITLVLGDINKETVEQIEKDKKELREKNDEQKKLNELKGQKVKNKGKTFTEIAKTIYVAIMGGAIRTYRKDNAESDFGLLAAKELLEDPDLSKLALVVKQNSKPQIEVLKKVEVSLDGKNNSSISDAVTALIAESKQLLSQTVHAKVIERLKVNKDISDWIELGLGIHDNHKSGNCEFCGQVLPSGRIEELSKHFNDADKELKVKIDVLVSRFSQIYGLISTISCPDKARFYDELGMEYEKGCKKLEQEKTELLKSITDIEGVIKEKKSKTTEPVSLTETINPTNFEVALEAIIKIIEQHNKKTDDFENEKNTAILKLKKHYLSTIFDEVKQLDNEIQECRTKIDQLNFGDKARPEILGIEALKARISDNQAKISSTHKACDDINLGLATFLGRGELIFEPNKITTTDESGKKVEVEDGYIIKRGGKVAQNLSEGEKTAIAFVYFTIHLKDRDFDLKNGIVVIDDPVSSLDSNSLFQAFAFLKNAVADAEQIFIFTHNFDFLRLLLNWVKHIDHGKENSYYMLKNCYTNNARCAYLDRMDKALYEYESEYHYLFKTLKTFESDGTIAQAYPIPNIARKVLDTFLMFRVPSGGGTYSKLEVIKGTTNFDKNKLTAIYKFTNDQSHITGSGFDPALVPETQKNVTYLLEMIKDVFPEHYKILEESVK
ncbi:MAG: AAA family ATPase [Patescibacteria group bacterium]|nr:AAA family ATPase [Patescibacteria group bacterium]